MSNFSYLDINQMINITEKDLYDYIFDQEKLTHDKIRYIELNTVLYNHDLDLLNELKENLINSVDELIVAKINEKIGNYSSNNQITLKKRIINTNLESLSNKIDFNETETSFIKDSYWDESNIILGKVVSTKDDCKIYIYSNLFKEIKDLKLTLYPSGDNHYSSSANLPLIINPRETIDEIIVQILS